MVQILVCTANLTTYWLLSNKRRNLYTNDLFPFEITLRFTDKICAESFRFDAKLWQLKQIPCSKVPFT